MLASNIYQKNGNLESSLRYYQLPDSVEEFLVDEKRNVRGEELRRKFDLVAKEAQIKLLETNQQLQEELIAAEKKRSLLYVALLLLSLGISVFIFIALSRIRKEKKVSEQLNTELQKSLDFQNTLSTVLSHDIRNYSGALEMGPGLVMDLIENQELDQAMVLLKELEIKLRSLNLSVSNLMLWAVPQLKMGVAILQSELNIPNTIDFHLKQSESLLKGFKIQLKQFHSGEEVVKISKNTFDVILRNTLFNAIKHSQATEIAIRTELKNKQLILSIRDNGNGLPQEVLSRFMEGTSALANHWKDTESGFGLWIMRYYADLSSTKVTYKREDTFSNFIFEFSCQE